MEKLEIEKCNQFVAVKPIIWYFLSSLASHPHRIIESKDIRLSCCAAHFHPYSLNARAHYTLTRTQTTKFQAGKCAYDDDAWK